MVHVSSVCSSGISQPALAYSGGEDVRPVFFFPRYSPAVSSRNLSAWLKGEGRSRPILAVKSLS